MSKVAALLSFIIYLLMRMSSSNRLSLGLACSIKFKAANLLTWQGSAWFLMGKFDRIVCGNVCICVLLCSLSTGQGKWTRGLLSIQLSVCLVV